MAQETIGTGLWSLIKSALNNNFNELYAQAPPDADRAFSHTYIAEGDEVATDILVPNTPTKYQLPVAIKELTNFEIADVGGGIIALRYIGLRDITLVLNATTSATTGSNNVVVKFMMYKNGVYEEGTMVARKIGTGSDLGAMGLSTSFSASTGDYFDVYVEADTATTITFFNTSIVINEVHQD